MKYEILDRNNLEKFNLISIINKDNLTKGLKKNKIIKIIFWFLIIIFFLVLVFIFFFLYYNNLERNLLVKFNNNLLTIKNDILALLSKKDIYKTNHIKENSINNEIEYLKYHQLYFCENQNLFNNSLIEEQLKSVKVNFNNITFDMIVYKYNDVVSNFISNLGTWELKETESILSSLFYYSRKKNITKNDIFMLDIGANIGWYSLFLGKNGFNIISFEPSKKNYYILLKNYCLNHDINMTIVNKGLDLDEKKCNLYHPLGNLGNAHLFCDIPKLNKTNYFSEEIKLSKLSNYIEYLKDKNLALIKLDIEGSEGRAILGGIDLIFKYHIPFIFMEFTPRLLRKKGTEPKDLLEMFEKNGYKISEHNFLSQEYSSIEELIYKPQTNIYISYENFIKK